MIELVYKERRSRFTYNEAVLKRYGDRYIVQWQSVKPAKGMMKQIPRGNGDKKLEESISRSKRVIREYAMCNPWQYFVTLTLDKLKVDRYDLNSTYKKLSQMIRDIGKKYDCKISYLLIPEKHKDGAWHFHGFMSGIPKEELKPSKKRSEKRDLYNWLTYSEKFGFNDIEQIEDKDRATSYIMKYISKDMAMSISEVNAKTYYCSRGLKKPEVIKKGTVSTKYNPDYVKTVLDNPVYSVQKLPPNTTLEEALTYLQEYNEIPFESIVDDDGCLISDIPVEWV